MLLAPGASMDLPAVGRWKCRSGVPCTCYPKWVKMTFGSITMQAKPARALLWATSPAPSNLEDDRQQSLKMLVGSFLVYLGSGSMGWAVWEGLQLQTIVAVPCFVLPFLFMNSNFLHVVKHFYYFFKDKCLKSYTKKILRAHPFYDSLNSICLAVIIFFTN